MPSPDRALALAAIALLGSTSPGRAQQRLVVQGLADAEVWSTDAGSRLLARDGGRLSGLGRIDLWGAARLARGLTAIALIEGESGAARTEPGTEVYLHRLSLQYAAAKWLTIEAGRFPSPFGGFAPRRLSSANPLIGRPDAYPVAYPWGAELTGLAGPVDFRLGVMDRPVSNERYVPRGGSRARIVLGGGVSPWAGLRIGASFTQGPYLGDEVAAALPPGVRWEDYTQRVAGVDGRFSRGYLELHGEAAFSRYEVPGRAGPADGVAGYLEAKYTWTPRLFTALRVERSRYAFIRPPTTGTWQAAETTFADAEVGIGYRLDVHTLLKLTYRRDRWEVAPSLRATLPNGHALALQVSRGFDVTAWLGPRP